MNKLTPRKAQIQFLFLFYMNLLCWYIVQLSKYWQLDLELNLLPFDSKTLSDYWLAHTSCSIVHTLRKLRILNHHTGTDRDLSFSIGTAVFASELDGHQNYQNAADQTLKFKVAN